MNNKLSKLFTDRWQVFSQQTSKENYFVFNFIYLFIYLLLFNYSCLHFLPNPSKPTSFPCFHSPPWFCPCVLYSSSWKPLSPLSPPHSPLVIVRLLFEVKCYNEIIYMMLNKGFRMLTNVNYYCNFSFILSKLILNLHTIKFIFYKFLKSSF